MDSFISSLSDQIQSSIAKARHSVLAQMKDSGSLSFAASVFDTKIPQKPHLADIGYIGGLVSASDIYHSYAAVSSNGLQPVTACLAGLKLLANIRPESQSLLQVGSNLLYTEPSRSFSSMLYSMTIPHALFDISTLLQAGYLERRMGSARFAMFGAGVAIAIPNTLHLVYQASKYTAPSSSLTLALTNSYIVGLDAFAIALEVAKGYMMDADLPPAAQPIDRIARYLNPAMTVLVRSLLFSSNGSNAAGGPLVPALRLTGWFVGVVGVYLYNYYQKNMLGEEYGDFDRRGTGWKDFAMHIGAIAGCAGVIWLAGSRK